MHKNEILSHIQNLVNEGTSILDTFPSKSLLAEEIRQIKHHYKQKSSSHLQNLFRILPMPSGTGWISRGLQLNHQTTLNREIEQRRAHFHARMNQLENRFPQWYTSAFETLQMTELKQLVPQLINAKSSSRLDSKFRKSVAVLEKALHLLSDENQFQKPLLIEKGQPLTGLNKVKEILRECTSFVKIQDPYANMELLEAIEAVDLGVKIILLLGRTACPKSQFDKGLNKLRKSGRQIDVAFIVDGANAPFHDRYIFSKKKAYSLGTSMNGIGLRDSSILPLQDWDIFEEKFDEYFNHGKTI